MSFRCDKCSRQVPRHDEKGKALEPRTPHHVVTKIRKTTVTGFEIVEEIDVCRECVGEVTVTTVNPTPVAPVSDGTLGALIADAIVESARSYRKDQPLGSISFAEERRLKQLQERR